MLSVEFSRDAEKFLSQMHPKHGSQIARKLLQLQENPHPHDSQRLKKSYYLRADCGEYRIIYEVNQDVLYIILIGKRNDDEVYRKLKRK